MDKKAKIVIVVLVVIGLLFAFGLVTNLAPKKGEKQGPANYDTSGWVSSVDSLMSYFSPKLDKKRLQMDAACKVAGTGYTFINDNKCTINIKKLPDDADDDIQTATLKLEKGVNVKVPCAEDEKPIIVPGTIGPTFMVSYTPRGENRSAPGCAGKDEVRLVVQKEGGTLELQCQGCNTQRTLQVTLK